MAWLHADSHTLRGPDSQVIAIPSADDMKICTFQPNSSTAIHPDQVFNNSPYTRDNRLGDLQSYETDRPASVRTGTVRKTGDTPPVWMIAGKYRRRLTGNCNSVMLYYYYKE